MLTHKARIEAAFTLLLLPAVSQAQAPKAVPPTAPVKTLVLPPVSSRPLHWQKALDGIGEYLPFPDSEALGIARWNGRILVGTSKGLLSSSNSQQWEIVPQLYGRALRPIGEKNGLLWLAEGDTKLLAIDKNFAIKKTFEPVKAPFRLNFDMNSFWRLDEKFFKTDWRWENEISLSEYGPNGQEKQSTESWAVLNEQPDWMAIDTDSVWLAALTYSGYRNSPHNKKKLIRINRATGKAESVDITMRVNFSYGKPAFANLPERILWIAPLNGEGNFLYQLDKKTLRVTTVKTFTQQFSAREFVADSKNLWIFPGVGTSKPLVLSLRDFTTVTPQAAGPMPPGSPAPSTYLRPGDTAFYQLLGSGTDRVWLSAPGPSLLELRDDGTAAARNLTALSLANVYDMGKNSRNTLYFDFRGNVVRVQAGDAPLAVRSILDFNLREGRVDLLNVNDRRVWLMFYDFNDNKHTAQLMALAPDLSWQCSTEPRTDLFQIKSVAFEDDLYYFVKEVLWKMDGKTGKISEVASLREQLPEIQSEMIYRPNEFHRGLARGFVLPDGRIAFLLTQFIRVTPGHGELKGQPLALLYDPQQDKWEVKPQETLPFRFIPVGPKMYGLRDEISENSLQNFNIMEWQGDSWHLLGRCALPSPRTYDVNGTARYLYFKTSFGLYRVAWSEFLRAAK